MENLGNSTRAGVGKTIMPVSTAVGGLGIAAVKTAADFDSAMSQVAAVSGATGDDLQSLRDKPVRWVRKQILRIRGGGGHELHGHGRLEVKRHDLRH